MITQESMGTYADRVQEHERNINFARSYFHPLVVCRFVCFWNVLYHGEHLHVQFNYVHDIIYRCAYHSLYQRRISEGIVYAL